jgi:drug/metabolite transporter (DMT)-like permease
MTQDPAVMVPSLPLTPLHDRRRAVTLFLIAITILATMDVLTKLASLNLSTVQVVWGRYLGQCVAMLLILGAPSFVSCFRSKVPSLHVLRALFLFVANFAFIASLRYLPLAEANVISFVSPLLLTALTYPVLGERVSPGRWAAVAAGFLGVLIVIRPGAVTFHWAVVLPLVMAIFGAFYHVLTPVVARTDDPTISIYFLSVIGAVCMSTIVPWYWTNPDLAGWAMLLAIGSCGMIGHILIVRAFAHAPASMLAPFFYTHLIWATIYGWSVFGDVPTLPTLIGGIFIITSGIYVYRSK